MENFTLDSGIVIKLVGISDTLQNMIVRRVEKEFRAKGEPIDPPTYTVKTAFGGEVMEETNPHTETTLEVTANDCMIDAGEDEEKAAKLAEQRTAENKRLWALHQAALKRMETEQNERRAKSILLGGIQFEMPADDSWEKMQEFMGAEIPTDPMEKRFHYLTTEVVKTPGDLLNVMQRITLLSYKGIVDEETIAAAMDSFRSNMGQTGDERGKDTGTTEVQAGQLELLHKVQRSTHGKRVGADTIPISAPE